LERLRRASSHDGEHGAPLADMPTRVLGERPAVAPSARKPNDGAKTGAKKKRPDGPVSAFHQPVPNRPKRLTVWLGICAVFLAVAGAAWWRMGGGAGGDAKSALPETKHVAVLPFETVGGDAATLALSDGLVETLTSKLTQLEQFQGTLMVVPSSEIRNEKISSVEQARRMFNLNLVITGSVQRWGERIQLTANLVDAVQVRQLGATTLDVDVDDMASLREGFVGRVAGLLELEMTPAARKSLVVAETNRPTAYRAYLEGRGYLQRFDVAGNTDLAVARFQEAIAQDPAYALAYAGLGEAYWKKAEVTYDPHWSALAIENAEHAVKLDENIPMTRVKLGSIYGSNGRHDDAIAEFQKALVLNPSSAEAYRGLGQVYAAAGRNDEAESAYKKSVELRPTDWYGYFLLARFYAGRGRFSEAETVYRQAIEISPDNDANYRNLAAVYGRIGREAEAVKLLETALRIQPSALTYSYLGVEHYYTGEFQNAAKNFEMAVDLNSNDYLLWGNLADAYKWIPGEQRKAEQAFRRAIELGEQKLAITPDDELLRSLLAEYWVKLGEAEKGLEIVRELGDYAKRSIHCRFHVATVFELTNQREKAVPEMIQLLDAGYTVRRIGEDPYLAGLWRDPRIRDAAARLGGTIPARETQ
jgi:serine/threonine-protein kinase